MEEELINYLDSVQKVDAKLFHQMEDIYGEKIVEQCFLECIQKMDSQDGNFYEKQLQIWDKFGYFLARLEYNPFENYILKEFRKNSKSSERKSYSGWEQQIQREPVFTLEEEVHYGFHLLGRPYIQLFLKEDDDITLDVLKIFSSIQTVEVRDIVLEKFRKFYQQCSRKSNFDNQFQKFLLAYQKECKKDNIPNIYTLSNFFDKSWNKESFEVMGQREMLEQLEMYIRYSIARNLFSICNLKLVESISTKYKSIMEPKDIIQYGTLGLIRSIQTFDIRKCHKFSTYASRGISLFINSMLKKEKDIIKIPGNVQALKSKIASAQTKFYQENGKNPTEEEIAILTNISVNQVKNILISSYQLSCDSLDQSIPSEDKKFDWNFWEIIEDKKGENEKSFEERYIFQTLFQECIKLIDSKLTDREKEVIFKRTGYLTNHAMTLKEISQEFGCSYESIRLIEVKALKKLRRVPHFQDYNPFK